MNGLAWVIFQRGRVDEAEELQRQAVEVLGRNREPQADVYIFQTEGSIALERGRVAEAVEHLSEGVELSRGYTVDQAPLLFYELVRLLLRTGDRTEAEGYRDLSGSGRAPATKAYAHAIEGLLEADPDLAIDRLRAAAEEFERLGLRIMQARVLADLGEALARTGQDPRPALEQARDLLVACDAVIYLPEVEALLANTAVGR